MNKERYTRKHILVNKQKKIKNRGGTKRMMYRMSKKQ